LHFIKKCSVDDTDNLKKHMRFTFIITVITNYILGSLTEITVTDKSISIIMH